MQDEHYVIPALTFLHIRKGSFQNKNAKGYHVMVGGCGIGHVSDLTAARQLAFKHVTERMNSKILELQAEIDAKKETLTALGEDYFNLGIFKNPHYHGHECNYFNGKKG